MPRLLSILDQGMRGKTGLAQPETYRSHMFTTIEINEGFAYKPLHRVRRRPSALPLSDKIEGTVLLSDTRLLPV